jgi:ATP-dependent DNA helicase DinG
VIEVEVHQQLRAFLRERGEAYWAHHLTMARLVARALRLGRSALMQTGAFPAYHGRYRLSYLVPMLMWPGQVVLVVPEAVQQRLLMVEIPQLRQWIQTLKPIRTGDRLSEDFEGVLLTTPESWLRDRLNQEGRFPAGVPTLIDCADDLEALTRNQLTASLHPSDWDHLMQAVPDKAEVIRDARIQLTKSVFQHPANPYDCYLLEPEEQTLLQSLLHGLSGVPDAWKSFSVASQRPNQLLWAAIQRSHGQFVVHCGPVEVASALEPIWSQQPIVLVGGSLDPEAEAPVYRQCLGLTEPMTCLKFPPDRQDEVIHLYLPDRLPMPNTPQFQPALLQELHTLLQARTGIPGLIVVLVGDTPLRAQVGSALAAEFGSRVQVERTCLDDNGVLVAGWEFWRAHQTVFPSPHLLIIATLPLPSLENPLVAGRVAHYKRLRQDWFRLYLLPAALSELQRAIAPVCENQGVVALLDSRVLHRTYGSQILATLQPMARLRYLDTSLFTHPDFLILE